MEEGRLAGASMAHALSLIGDEALAERAREINRRMGELRLGSHGDVRRIAREEIIREYHTWRTQQ
jgi:hypothetical protein